MHAFSVAMRRSMSFEAGKATDIVRTRNRVPGVGFTLPTPPRFPPGLRPFPPFIGTAAESILLTEINRA